MHAIISKAQTFDFAEDTALLHKYARPMTREKVLERYELEKENDAIQKSLSQEYQHLKMEIFNITFNEEDKATTELKVIRGKSMNISFLKKGDALIYIAITRVNESNSMVQQQLEMLHVALISSLTSHVLKELVSNASLDLVGELWLGLPLLRCVCMTIHNSPASFLNMYLPLRYG